MSNLAPNVPEDLTNSIRKIVGELLGARFERKAAKVKLIHESGPNAGMIEVFCQKITPFGQESDPGNWRPAIPGTLVLPAIGDTVDVQYADLSGDMLIYFSQSGAYYQRIVSGPGLKVIFEYQVGTEVFAIYFDSLSKKFVLQAGQEQAELSTTGIKTLKELKVGMDVTIMNETTPTPVFPHKHNSGAPAAPTGPIIPGT